MGSKSHSFLYLRKKTHCLPLACPALLWDQGSSRQASVAAQEVPLLTRRQTGMRSRVVRTQARQGVIKLWFHPKRLEAFSSGRSRGHFHLLGVWKLRRELGRDGGGGREGRGEFWDFRKVDQMWGELLVWEKGWGERDDMEERGEDFRRKELGEAVGA